MTTVAEAIKTGNKTLKALSKAADKADRDGNSKANKSLLADWDKLSDALMELEAVEVLAENAKIAKLNTELAKVTKATEETVSDLKKVKDISSKVTAILGIIDGILKALP
jgi:hypothetical protein